MRSTFALRVRQSRDRMINHPGHADQSSHGRKRGSGAGAEVRGALAGHESAEQVSAAAAGEAKRITGRDVEFALGGMDTQVAAEHAEGILRGLERYPNVPVRRVQFGGGDRMAEMADSWAETNRAGTVITFTRAGQRKGPEAYRRDIERAHREGYVTDGSPTGMALHEFGHAVANSYSLNGVGKNAAKRYADQQSGSDWAETAGSTISKRAGEDHYELSGEAFTDVMVHGSKASGMSKAVVAEFDRQVRADDEAYTDAGRSVGAAAALLVSNHPGHSSQKSHGHKGSGSPAAMHDEAQLLAAYTFTDSVTGYHTEVVGIHKPGEPNPDLNERLGGKPTVPPGRTMVTVRIVDADGKRIGEACRTVHPANQARVNHNFLVLNEGQRGQGFATRFNAHAEQTYRANGIKMITLHANIDVGGYAWARAGYDFRNGRTRSATVANAYVESIKRRHPDAAISRFRELHLSGTATPLDLAMVGHTPGASTWPGKEIMLDSDWQGVKLL